MRVRLASWWLLSLLKILLSEGRSDSVKLLRVKAESLRGGRIDLAGRLQSLRLLEAADGLRGLVVVNAGQIPRARKSSLTISMKGHAGGASFTP